MNIKLLLHCLISSGRFAGLGDSSRGQGSGFLWSPKNFFQPFGPHFGLKIGGGGQVPRASPGFATGQGHNVVFLGKILKARLKRRATAVLNSIDRIKFDFSTAVA